jgi:iron complex outermembrane receptor protein
LARHFANLAKTGNACLPYKGIAYLQGLFGLPAQTLAHLSALIASLDYRHAAEKPKRMRHGGDTDMGSAQKSGARARRKASLLCATAIAAAMWLAPSAAFAQDGASNSDEIVITARRRDETLSRVPVAVTALSEAELVERAVRTDSDLQAVAPGLTIRQTQGNNSLTYALRGQTGDTFSGSPTAVITYLNEVPVAVNGASSFYDLQSVQVLKGPQGTLFGRNGTGGSVLYTSAQPADDFGASIRGRVGNYELRELEGMVNVPIIDDRVLLRFAFNTLEREGYIDNLTTGDTLGNVHRDSARLSLTLRPTSTLENLTVVQASQTDGTNTGASYVWSIYGTSTTCPVNNGFQLNCATGFLNDPPFNSVETQREIGAYKTLHPGGARHQGEDWMVTNTTNWDINDNLTLRNILGVVNSETTSEQPQLGAAFPSILTANIDTGESGNSLDVESLSEELQLQGTAGDLTYVVGVYYQDQQVDTRWPQTYFGVQTVTNAFRTDNTTTAAYAQGTYDLASWTGVEGLALTVGARYTREEVEFEVMPGDTRIDVYPDTLLPTAAGESLVGLSES